MTEHRTFVCAVCGALCLTDTPEAEANRELLNSGIRVKDDSNLVSACDSCYQVVMNRARQLGLVDPETSREGGGS